MNNLALIAEDLTLESIESLAWRLLRDGAEGQFDVFRFPVLATRSADGVDARVVVLRRVDRGSRMLEFHTDRRSAKTGQLAASAEMSWVFYDPETRLQLRVRGSGGLCDDEQHLEARWSALSDHTRKGYAQELSPGTRVDQIIHGAPCAHVEDTHLGRPNFAVVECLVREIEWLLLSRRGHQRAVMSCVDGQWSSSWLMP